MIHDVPLTRYVKFPARPPALPIRSADDPGGPEFVVRAQFKEWNERGVKLIGATQNGSYVQVSVSVAAPGIVRVLLEPAETAASRTTLARDLASLLVRVLVEQSEKQVLIKSDLITVQMDLDPFKLIFIGPDGQKLLEQNAVDADVTGRTTGLPFGFSQVGGQRAAFHDTFSVEPDEHFYGFGEKFTNFDKRGQRLEMWNYDAFGAHSERAYKNVPFFMSTRGYGIFVDSLTRVNFDMAASCHATFSIIAPDSALDYYVISGPDLKSVLTRYSQLVSFPVAPPKWSLGLWMSSGFLSDNADAILRRAHLLREHQIPCDVLHIDPFWMSFGSWSDLEWDREAFPDPEGLIRQVHELGFHLCLWINSYIGVKSPHFKEFSESGYFLKNSLGETLVLDLWSGDHPPVAVLDLTNPQATHWFREALRSIIRMGVDSFKTDFGEGVPFDAQSTSGITGATLHNQYPLIYNDLVSQVIADESGATGLVWSRSSYAGGQRHPAQWSGDPNCTFSAMASTMRGGLSLAMCGHAFWSHDIGGFKGKPTPELYTRWAQFGAFTPMARAHGTTSRLPWEYGEEACSIFRDYFKLRYRLLPYLYHHAVIAAQQGLPILRPMVLEYPQDPNTYSLDLQYLFGSDFLVAPIYNQSGKRPVYLPAGKWINYWSREVYSGPQTLFVEAPLNILPLFVRADSLIPTWQPTEPLTDAPFDPVIFEAYLLNQGNLDLCDTDGQTQIRAARTEQKLEIQFSGAKQRFSLHLPALKGPQPVESVFVNGLPLACNAARQPVEMPVNSWISGENGKIWVRFQS